MMKVVILAGGYGTRLSEYTRSIPKPMVEIGMRPILWHILNLYAKQGFNDFIIALGYKAEVIKQYFIDYIFNNSDIEICLENGEIKVLSNCGHNWNIKLIDTGADTMTGGRLKRLSRYLTETFMITYGDGLSDVSLNSLIEVHQKSKATLTITAVNPGSRYGEISISDNGQVVDFIEKPSFSNEWVNGGFMVAEPSLLDIIKSDDTILEKDPIQKLARDGKLYAFRHEGFWQCMDNLRDKKILEEIILSGATPWLN